MLRDIARLHYDLAGFPVPRQLDALLTITDVDHLHYGSDYPFTRSSAVAMAAERLEAAGEAPGPSTQALRTNTTDSFPRSARPLALISPRGRSGLSLWKRLPGSTDLTTVPVGDGTSHGIGVFTPRMNTAASKTNRVAPTR